MSIRSFIAASAIALWLPVGQSQQTAASLPALIQVAKGDTVGDWALGAYIPTGITYPIVADRVVPTYAIASMGKERAEVWLDAVVETDGSIQRTFVEKVVDKAIDPSQPFVKLSDDAIKQWRFKPGSLSGQPVRVFVLFTVIFNNSGVRIIPYLDTPSVSTADFDRGAYRWGPGLTNPVVQKKVDPTYTHAAMSKKITGEVLLDVVVETNGRIQRVRIRKSLDKTYGLDDAAIAAAKQWVFEPGKLLGRPVPMAETLIMEYLPR